MKAFAVIEIMLVLAVMGMLAYLFGK